MKCAVYALPATHNLVLAGLAEPGHLAVVIPAEAERREGETDEQLAARVAAQAVPPGVNFAVVEASAVPQDRTFREAWKEAGGQVTIDMVKARKAHKRRLMAIRELRLAQIREKIDQAEDAGNTARVILLKARRKKLRELDALSLDAILDPESLKAFMPVYLLDDV